MRDYALGMYEKAMPDAMPLPKKIEAAKACGFDALELCVDGNAERAKRLDWEEHRIRELRQIAEAQEMPLTTLSLSLLRKYPLGHPDEERNRLAFVIVEKACRLAVGLGSRIMLINGYDVYDEESTPETRARFYRNLRKVLQICARHGVLAGIENAEKAFCSRIKDAVAICEKVSSPYLAVYGDIGNATIAADGDVSRAQQDILSGTGYLTSLHLKDGVPGEYRYHAIGDGMVDFSQCLQAAKQANVHLFTAEIFCNPEEDYIAHATKVAHFLRRELDAVYFPLERKDENHEED